MCYFGSWSTYRWSFGHFDVEDIDPFLCTHLVFGFAGLDQNNFTLISLDPYNDLYDNWGKGAYQRFTDLKTINPQLKVHFQSKSLLFLLSDIDVSQPFLEAFSSMRNDTPQSLSSRWKAKSSFQKLVNQSISQGLLSTHLLWRIGLLIIPNFLLFFADFTCYWRLERGRHQVLSNGLRSC